MSTKMLTKARVKATITDEQHVIEYYACTFSKVPDKNGDIIDPGALDEWLATFYKSGFPMPVSFTHGAVLDSTDPFAIVGYAPADKEHVFKDSYGLRVRAFLDTGANEQAQQVYMLTKRGIVTGASIAYVVPTGGEEVIKNGPQRGSTLITKMFIKESGPCLDPANDDAYVISVKNLLGAPSVPDELARLKAALEVKAADDSAWDGNAAMSACKTAADYRQICAAEHTTGSPDERQHWALPHHFLGKGANVQGVEAAAGFIDRTQNITDAQRSRARTHLEDHMNKTGGTASKAAPVTVTTQDALVQAVHEGLELKAGRKISAANIAKIRAMRDSVNETVDELLSLVEQDSSSTVEGKANEPSELRDDPELGQTEPSPNADLHEALAAALQ